MFPFPFSPFNNDSRTNRTASDETIDWALLVNDKQVHHLVDGHRSELGFGNRFDNLLDVTGLKVRGNVPLKLGVQQRGTFSTTTLVTDRVVDVNFVQHGTVVQGDGQGVANESLLRVVVFGRERLVLNASDLDTVQTRGRRVSFPSRGISSIFGA